MDNIKRGPSRFNNNFPQRRPIPGRVPMRRPIQGMPMRRPPFPGQNMHGSGAKSPVNQDSKKVSNKLLIIGLSVLVFIIILILIIVLIAKNSNEDINKKQLDMKIENVKLEEESVQVDLKVDPKEEKIIGIKFILETEDDYEVFKEDVSISKLTEKKFTFELKEINGKKITRISVSPIFENKKGEEILGSVEDDYFIKTSENLSEEEYPNSFYDDYNSYEYYEQEYSEEYSEYWNYENETSLGNETTQNNYTNQNTSQTNYSNINYPNESASFCGNGVVNTGEYCDSNNFAGETCESLGYASGILGCRKTCEFDTRYCVAKTPMNNTPISNTTTNPPVNCVSYSYSQCYNGDVYWYNSCGVRESVKEDCFSDENCINGECVVKQTTPTCTSNSYSACYNNDVYWYNSCGVRGIIREDCTSSETCTNGECVITTYSCSGSNTRTCSITNGVGTQSATCNTANGQWVWGTCSVTSCNTGYQINGNTCIASCSSNSYSQCYNGDVYWYNSCGVRGSVRYDCTSSQTCSNGACVSSNSGNGDFSFTHSFISTNLPTINGNGMPSLADFDNDGDLDFSIGSAASGHLYLFKNSGSSWSSSSIGDVGLGHLAGINYDVNNDGWEDIITGGVWYKNNQGNGFTRYTYDSSISKEIHDIILGDINKVGRLDVIALGEYAGFFWYNIPSDPTQTWTRVIIDPKQTSLSPRVHGGFSPGGIGDLDGDGDNDIFRAISWFENKNNGSSWIEHYVDTSTLFKGDLPYGRSMRSVIIDIDNDGDNDVVFTECDKIDSKAGIFYNNGAGSFTLQMLPQTASGRRSSLHSLRVLDINLDNYLDIISIDQEDMMTSSLHSPRWYAWTNTGNGWKENVLLDTNLGGHDLLVKDVDQDGDLDLVSKVWNKWSLNANNGIPHAEILWNNKIQQKNSAIKLSMNPSSGWHEHGNGLWQSVNGGYITGQQDPPGSGNGGFLISDQTFGDYEVVFDVWPDYGIDSGIFLRNTNTDEQAYQVTIDYQPENPMGSVYITNVGDYREFSLVNENEISGSSPYFDSDAWSYIWKENDWNQFRISIEGNPPKIIVWINGFKVHEFTDTQVRFPSSGYIALQVHPGSSEWPSGKVVRFRNIKVYPK